MARIRTQDPIIDEFDAAIREAARMNTRSLDGPDAYGLKNGGQSSDSYAAGSAPMLPSVAVLNNPENLSTELAGLAEVDRRHVETMCNVVRGKLNDIKRIIAEFETELDDEQSRRIAAGAVWIEKVHKMMSVAPEMERQIKDMAATVRASGT